MSTAATHPVDSQDSFGKVIGLQTAILAALLGNGYIPTCINSHQMVYL